MGKVLTIANVDDETAMHFRILAIGRGVKQSVLLKQLVGEAWENDSTPTTKRAKARIKKLIRKIQ